MGKTCIFIVLMVVVLGAVAGVLTWWFVSGRDSFKTVELNSFGELNNTAAYTEIRGVGNVFWWFYPTINTSPNHETLPLIIWLDGITGLPPSLLANFGMFGPYDYNLNIREDSWVNNYHLLFIDSPIGTGFSTANDINNIPTDLESNTDHLMKVLESFYSLHENYSETPLYIFGQSHGAQLALSLAERISKELTVGSFTPNIKGLAIGNGIVSPALALSKTGFYLEEMGYIDGNGRSTLDAMAAKTSQLVQDGNTDEAFDEFLSLADLANELAAAVYLGHIVEKLTKEPSGRINNYPNSPQTSGLLSFMEEQVAPKLGIDTNNNYDSNRNEAIAAFRSSFMVPAVEKLEYILQNTTLGVSIYNGNLDAVSNTPGQLEWVNNLRWLGQQEFLSSQRETLIISGQIEGYFRGTDRLRFFWINAAGVSAPLDSPVAMRTVVDIIVRA